MPRRPPRATYRLQLGPRLSFADAAGLVGHLNELGVSHLYVSPVTEAEPGSEHGYDVTDHTTIRRELGGPDGLSQLSATLQGADIGLVVDVVPNHASIASPRHNRRWWDTLRHGPGHDSARFFDIDWSAHAGKVIMPVLNAPLDQELAAGRITVTTIRSTTADGDGGGDGDEGGDEVVVRYGGLELPVAPGTGHLPLPDLLAAQHYRLMAWRRPTRNLRRFFVIDSLAALRAEDDLVADEVNAIPRRLWLHDLADGFRVDHVDGLAQPGRYLRRLRRDAPEAWIVVEKILASGERPPEAWPVAGTTGYDFLRMADHLLLDPTGEAPLTELWHEVSGDHRTFAEHARAARHEVLDDALAPDLGRVAALAAQALPTADAGRIRRALAALTVETDRYRTYLADDPEATAVIDALATRTLEQRPDLAVEVTALAELLVSPSTPPAMELATRWQQLTAPVVAKGDEDRAFYRYHRLSALCEVGGEPGRFGLDRHAFHAEAAWRADHAPASMLAGTTHDTKRSEDVRARLLTLAEIPDRWRDLTDTVMPELLHVDGALSASDCYLALQTAVGAWPISADRLGDFLVKAAREAAVHTGWIDPDDGYEDALGRLARHLAGPAAPTAFVGRISVAGWANSLAQLVLRLTAPGVPDIYQGTETWSYRLVDPDNRADPDWAALRAQTERALVCDMTAAWAAPHTGMIKTAVLARTLALRARRPLCFEAGAAYVPVPVQGYRAHHAVAFQRGSDVVVAVVRLPLGLDGDWGPTEVTLPPGSWRNVFQPSHTVAGGRHPAAAVFAGLPVAVLERS